MLGRHWFFRELPRQQERVDCGYICVAAVLRAHGVALSVPDVKRIVGTTTRGLTLRQLRDAFKSLGFQATTIRFSDAETLPCPSVVLLAQGHYIAVVKIAGHRLTVFDPQSGWGTVRSLDLASAKFAVAVPSKDGSITTRFKGQKRLSLPVWPSLRRAMLSRAGQAAAMLAVVTPIVSLVIPLLAQQSIDLTVPGGHSSLARISIAFLLVSVLGAVCGGLTTLVQAHQSANVMVFAGRELITRLSSKDGEWLRSRSSDYPYSQLMAMSAVEQFYASLVPQISTTCVLFVAAVIAMSVISPWLLVPGIAAVVLSAVLDLLFQSPRQQLVMQDVHVQAKYRNFLFDVLPQIHAVQRSGSLSSLKAALRKHCAEVSRIQIRSSRASAAKSAVSQLVTTADRLVFLVFAAYLARSHALSLGVFVSAGLYKELVSQALSSLFRVWHQHMLLYPRHVQLQDLMATGAASQHQQARVRDGSLSLSNVSFRFGSLDPWTLYDVSLSVSARECVLLRGPSGSGKSTILRIACGDLQPSEGYAEIDGCQVTNGMRGVASVLQIDRLISGSIDENIRFMRSAVTEDEIEEVCALVGLTEYIRSLPMRFNTQIGEGNVGLSAGQKQRILIARALIRNPRLLILDEATSGLDPPSEMKILKRIRARHTTLIICSHRPGLEEIADRVYEVDRGIVTCMGVRGLSSSSHLSDNAARNDLATALIGQATR